MLAKDECRQVLATYIDNENLRHHCEMVAAAMEAYATDLGLDQEETMNWWTAGLLHDLDWEKYPDEHPNYALEHIFPGLNLAGSVTNAIRSHAPERTGKKPETRFERYLFACDEISGFMHAVSLMRPGGFDDMQPKSVTKKMKDKRFAENVSRHDINLGAELIGKDLQDHISFLIEVFRK
jgi:putative nucleotidyltransferase with HDIG domain